jgi:formate dehydrogenase iron-sulfur subunit
MAMQLNRRDFLKLSGTALASGIALSPANVGALSSRESEVGILYDASKCVGCRACQEACKDWNKLPVETTDAQELYETPLDLSADTWTLIKLNKSGQADWHFFSYQCMHCTDAACVTVCPTGALFKDTRGFVAFDEDKCNGCGYCTQFCPFGVPHLETKNLLTGEAKAAKCTFCQDRIWGGLGGPACAEACPVGALVWGQWKGLLDQARERVAVLHDQGLSGARLYGENEAGGLHRLSIILEEPRQYNLPDNPPGALAGIWQNIIQPLGEIAVVATAVGLLVDFLVARRYIKVEEEV